MSSLWVSKKRKAELIELCEQLGIQTDGYLKNDIESLLAEYLDSHQAELVNDSTFGAYYDTLITRRSPTKGSGHTILIAPTDAPTTRSRWRASKERYGREGSTAELSTGEESSPVPSPHQRTLRSGSRQLSARTPRSVRVIHETVPPPLPPTPAVVADAIESRVNAIVDSAKKTVEKAAIQEKAIGLRDRLSSVVSVNAVTLTYEAVLLLYQLIPFAYLVTIPAVPALNTGSHSFHLPDLFVLLTLEFWGPFFVWLTTAVFVPLGNAYFFNLTAAAANVARSKPYDPTVSTTPEEYKIDPLTFAVTKALVVYLVHYKGFDFLGLLGDESLKIVGTGIGKDTQLIIAGISGLAAIWESVLKR